MPASVQSDRLPVERPEDCVSRTLTAVGTGLVAGGIMGAVTANWSNVPPVLRDRPWPALKYTGETCMGTAHTHVEHWPVTHRNADCARKLLPQAIPQRV